MSSSRFDVQALRAKFPALQQDQVYLDNAGGSQILGVVVDAIRDYLIGSNVQVGASYKVGRLSTDRVAEGFVAGAKYINASKDEIVFGGSTTQLFRNLSLSLNFQPGDEIVVSAVDHEANIASWVDLAERQGLTLKWWKPEHPTNPKLTVENLKGLLSDKTRLLTLTHCSNILGSIHDVKAITTDAHQYPALLVCVDGVAYAPHRQIDVRDLGVDFYSFSWYKVYGPHVSMLYASRKAQQHMRPLGHYFNPTASLSDKLSLAAGSYELVSSVPVLVDHLLSEGWEGVKEQELALQAPLLDYLANRGDVTIYGEKNPDPNIRAPIISFKVRGWGSQELVEAVEQKTKLGFRWGSFYSQRLIKDILGLDPVDAIVRVSMAHYNTVEEIKAVIAALEEIVVKR
ncbi:hypothetical protein FDECE_4889 [Fusarium decemcellulare]|nr:hypothetical protein FDECE_4889 [Fusarium decemcellulare]